MFSVKSLKKPQGPQGPQGPEGDVGATGDQGPAGENGVFSEFFKSTEQTGTSSEQNIAHGLASTPSLVIVIPTNCIAAAVFTEGEHDATNCKVTATIMAKYKVVALK